MQLALQEVIGAYALAVLDKDNPDGIIAARKSSPLVVGIGEGEFFLASDATPIVEYTDKVVYLEDEEIALIRRGEKLKAVSYTHLTKVSSSETLPFALYTFNCRLSLINATPALSYPRYSNRFRPLIRMG